MLANLQSLLAKHWQLPSLRERGPALASWFSQARTQHLLRGECRIMRSLIEANRGQRILQLSLVPNTCPGVKSPYRHLIKVFDPAVNAPSGELNNEQSVLIAEYDHLPFDEQSIDLVIIHHLLEFADEPQLLLKEAARVCSHGGEVLVLAFNPLSLSGIWAMLSGHLRRHTGWCRRLLFVYRIKDWLRFVDCKPLRTQHICHTLPINHSSYLRFSARFCHWLDTINFPFSSVICVQAKKEQAGMNLLKPDWRVLVLSRAIQGARATQPLRSKSNTLKNSD